MYVPEGELRSIDKLWVEFAHSSKNKKSLPPLDGAIQDGSRGVDIYKYGCKARKLGFNDGAIGEFVRVLGKYHCNPPVEDRRIQSTIKSVCKFPPGESPPHDELIEAPGKKFEGRLLENDDRPGEWMHLLGFDSDNNFYYQTSSNLNVISLSAASHTKNNLLSLMPYEFYKASWPTKTGVGWDRAASELMEKSRQKGNYSNRDVRGRGAWQHQGKTILHLGSSTYDIQSRQSQKIGRNSSGHIFKLCETSRNPGVPDYQTHSCQRIIDAVESLAWKKPAYAKLFLGWLFIARMCGALKWRPHIWVTGEKGTGKSTVLNMILRPVFGDWAVFCEGETTAAGLRQKLKCNALPVLFEESETMDKRSGGRIANVVEFFRSCSSETDSTILKGTVDGKGHQYKTSSMACLSSIRVNLETEQDKSRFCVLELERPDPGKWKEVEKKLLELDLDYGNFLFDVLCERWSEFEGLLGKVSDELAEKFDRRVSDQYAPLLAGYLILTTKDYGELDEFDVGRVVSDVKETICEDTDSEADQEECLDVMCQFEILYDDGARVSTTIEKAILAAYGGSVHAENELLTYGIKVTSDRVHISTNNPKLIRRFAETKWVTQYGRALSRLRGAKKAQTRFVGRVLRCISLPVALFKN